jgi:hypothetical protein
MPEKQDSQSKYRKTRRPEQIPENKTAILNTGKQDGHIKYRKTRRPYQIPENKTAISNTGAEYNRKNKMKYCCNT